MASSCVIHIEETCNVRYPHGRVRGRLKEPGGGDMGAKKKGKSTRGVFPRLVIAGEDGFSMLELIVVLIVIGIIVGTGVIGYFTTMRQSDVKASAEMVKEAISMVQGLADSGITHNGERDRYRIEFHDNAASPPNAFRIQKQEYNGAAWGSWVNVAPEQGTYMKLAGSDWVQPSSSSDLQVSYSIVNGAANYNHICFVSVGSVVRACVDPGTNPTEPMTVTVTSVSKSKSIVTTVTEFGEITYVE